MPFWLTKGQSWKAQALVIAAALLVMVFLATLG
jgi:hypothetical protein